jgi:hypothetical protein
MRGLSAKSRIIRGSLLLAFPLDSRNDLQSTSTVSPGIWVRGIPQVSSTPSGLQLPRRPFAMYRITKAIGPDKKD